MAAPAGFHPLRVARVVPEATDSLTLVLAVPADLQAAFRAVPGQHVTVRFELEVEEVRRNYSITSFDTPGEIAITVRRVPGGLVSGHIHRNVEAGAFIDVASPTGRFVVPAPTGAPRTHVAIVAGSGITPVIGMIEQVLAGDETSRYVLLFGNRTSDRIIFRERLEALKNRHLGRLAIVHVLSRDEGADVPLLAGRIDGARVARLLPVLVSPLQVDQYYLCGPDSMIKAVREALLAAGVPREAIKFEFFKTGPELPPRARSVEPEPSKASESASSEVTITFDGVRRTFRVPKGGHVVDAALAAGITVPYSCKGGMCCTCRAKLVDGRVEMTRNYSLEAWEMQAGFVLACQSVPLTERVVLDFDRV